MTQDNPKALRKENLGVFVYIETLSDILIQWKNNTLRG